MRRRLCCGDVIAIDRCPETLKLADEASHDETALSPRADDLDQRPAAKYVCFAAGQPDMPVAAT